MASDTLDDVALEVLQFMAEKLRDHHEDDVTVGQLCDLSGFVHFKAWEIVADPPGVFPVPKVWH